MEKELFDNYFQAQERALELINLNAIHIEIHKKRFEPKWEIDYYFPNQQILDIIDRESKGEVVFERMRDGLIKQLERCYTERDLKEEKEYIDNCYDKGFIDDNDYEILIEYYNKLLDKQK